MLSPVIEKYISQANVLALTGATGTDIARFYLTVETEQKGKAVALAHHIEHYSDIVPAFNAAFDILDNCAIYPHVGA